MPDNTSYREQYGLTPRKPKISRRATFNFSNSDALEKFQQELILRGYSKNTQRAYTSEFIQFLKHIKKHDAASISEEKLRAYLQYCQQTLKIPASSMHARMNALNFYYRNITKTPHKIQSLPRPKKNKSLPNVLSLEEVARLLEATKNIKHKMILATAYGMG